MANVFEATFAGDTQKFHTRNSTRSMRAPEFLYPESAATAKVPPKETNFPLVTREGLSSVGLMMDQDSVSLRMIVTGLTEKGKEMASRVWKGDIVIQVDGHGTSSMSLDELNVLLAGPTG
jgi:C-terminal processing protease CtpA/Prc